MKALDKARALERLTTKMARAREDHRTTDVYLAAKRDIQERYSYGTYLTDLRTHQYVAVIGKTGTEDSSIGETVNELIEAGLEY